MPLVVITGTKYQSIIFILLCVLGKYRFSHVIRAAMQWEEHSSLEACQLAGGGAGQEGGAGLRGADAGRPHQEPGEVTSLAVRITQAPEYENSGVQ